MTYFIEIVLQKLIYMQHENEHEHRFETKKCVLVFCRPVLINLSVEPYLNGQCCHCCTLQSNLLCRVRYKD